jgi:hypothetical protein
MTLVRAQPAFFAQLRDDETVDIKLLFCGFRGICVNFLAEFHFIHRIAFFVYCMSNGT